jgi:hypothetical protein
MRLGECRRRKGENTGTYLTSILIPRKWRWLFASPFLDIILEQSPNSNESCISLLPRTGRYGWFYEELNRTINSFRWLPISARNSLHHYDYKCFHCQFIDILVDHIVFSIASQTIRVPLSCSYTYLQALGINSTQNPGESTSRGLANLTLAPLFGFLKIR